MSLINKRLKLSCSHLQKTSKQGTLDQFKKQNASPIKNLAIQDDNVPANDSFDDIFEPCKTKPLKTINSKATNVSDEVVLKDVQQCPLCFKTNNTKDDSFIVHLKSCANKHKLTIKQLMDAVLLQEKQFSERIALGIPIAPIKKFSKKQSKKGPVDSNFELAVALSKSLREAEEVDILRDAEKLVEAGLEDEALSKRKELANFGFLTNSTTKEAKKPFKKQWNQLALFKRTQEERERILSEKIGIVLLDFENTTESATCDFRIPVESSYLLSHMNEESKLWYKSQMMIDDNYYVEELSKYVTPSGYEIGCNLKHVSQIPGRWKTPEKEKSSERIEHPESFNEFENVAIECTEVERTGSSDECSESSVVRSEEYENSGYVEKCKENGIASPAEPESLDYLEECTGKENQDWFNVCPKSINFGQYSPDPDEEINSSPKTSMEIKPIILEEKMFRTGKEKLCENWKNMIGKEEMCDLKIRTKFEKYIPAHKLVFLTRCDKILKDVIKEDGEDVILWTDYSYDSVMKFLEFIYAASIPENKYDLDLKLLSLRYEVDELIQIISKKRRSCSPITGSYNFKREKLGEEKWETAGDEKWEKVKDEKWEKTKRGNLKNLEDRKLGKVDDGKLEKVMDIKWKNTVDGNLKKVEDGNSENRDEKGEMVEDGKLKNVSNNRMTFEFALKTDVSEKWEGNEKDEIDNSDYRTCNVSWKHSSVSSIQLCAEKMSINENFQTEFGLNKRRLSNGSDEIFFDKDYIDSNDRDEVGNGNIDSDTETIFPDEEIYSPLLSNSISEENCKRDENEEFSEKFNLSDRMTFRQVLHLDSNDLNLKSFDAKNFSTEAENSKNSKNEFSILRKNISNLNNSRSKICNTISKLDDIYGFTNTQKDKESKNISNGNVKLYDSFSFDENLLRNLEKVPTPTPTSSVRKLTRKSKSDCFSTPTTSTREIEMNDATALPDYTAMRTIEIKKELDKYGIKPGLSRNKAKKLLRHIYRELHPSATPTTNRTISITNDSSNSTESSKSQETSKLCSKKLSLDDGFRKLLDMDKELHKNILTYEPVSIESIKKSLKIMGVKCTLKELISYLDEKCITFRSEQRPFKSKMTKKPKE